MFVVENINNATVINVQAKKLELFECLSLKKIITGISNQKNRDIIINLGSITNLNNLFVEKLICSGKHCEKNNCTIALCGVNHNILCILYLLNLDRYFEFYENEQEALLRENRLVKRRLKAV